MKVRYLTDVPEGPRKGEVGYLGYHEVQARLQSAPDSIEILDGAAETTDSAAREAGNPVENSERGDVSRHPIAARDLSEEADATAVTTAGHGVAGPNADRTGPSVEHATTEPAGAPDYDAMTRTELDALAASRGVDVTGARTKADVIAALRR